MTNVLDVLNQHGCFISDTDEAEMDEIHFSGMTASPDYDHADMALRTCMCGTRINGFDEYHQHLREAIERTIQ